MVEILFNDSRRWGQYSFLDLLERNDVAFTFDGTNLSFPTKSDEIQARDIWECLTGIRQIGAV